MNSADVEMVMEALGSVLGGPGWVVRADLDADNAVTAADLAILTADLALNGPRYCEGFACPADFDVSGEVTADDIFAFLDLWFAQNGQSGAGLRADVDASGGVTADDIFAFLDAWFAANGVGCG